MSKEILQDEALGELKLCFQIIEEIHNQENKSKIPIFEKSLRFTFQELARTLHALSEISADSVLIDKSSFLTPLPTSLSISELQPQLLVLQKYLLANLL